MSLTISISICILIFIFSSQSGDVSSSVSAGLTRRMFPSIASENIALFIEHILRKMAHFSIYLALGMAVFYTYDSFICCFAKRNPHGLLKIIFPAVFCFLYSVSDELHQLFVPGRKGSFSDCIIDTFGALCGILITVVLRCIINRLKRNKS